MKVRVYGDMAVATYGSTDKGSYKGKDISGRFRWTDVFVKRNGRWEIVAGQGTRISQP
jgi:ketosteroid isomerase-like protein